MPRVCNHGLRIEDVSSHPLRNRHPEVRIQANSSYPHTGIILVRRREVGIVVVVVVVRVAHMCARLGLGERGHCWMLRVQGIRKRLKARKGR